VLNTKINPVKKAEITRSITITISNGKYFHYWSIYEKMASSEVAVGFL